MLSFVCTQKINKQNAGEGGGGDKSTGKIRSKQNKVIIDTLKFWKKF